MATRLPPPTSHSSSTQKFQDLHVSAAEIPVPDLEAKLQSLKPLLSEKASVLLPSDLGFKEVTTRWGDHNRSTPGAVVNVSCEEDICAAIKFATSHSLPFFAQSGTHSFSSTLSRLPPSSFLLLNLRALNNVSVSLPASSPTGTATIGGGTLTHEVLSAAHAAKAHIVTGVCDTVGIVPALLGGGFGNLMSLYGLGVDNILEARVVTAKGEVVVVSADAAAKDGELAELWWGIRGAGWNFGVVSQLKVRAFREVNEGVHWTGMLGFQGEEARLKEVLGVLGGMEIGKGMGVTVLWARMPPSFEPLIILLLWYGGSTAAAESAFSALLSLPSPVLNICGPTPYPQINAVNTDACRKGGRKPVFSVGLKEEELQSVNAAWGLWERFSGENQDARASVVMVECYGWGKARELGAEKGGDMAFPWRECGIHVLGIPMYTDPSLDDAARDFGDKFRATLRAGGDKKVYSNFATGDEDPEVLYGGKERIERLRRLKKSWDPEGCFDWYNPIR